MKQLAIRTTRWAKCFTVLTLGAVLASIAAPPSAAQWKEWQLRGGENEYRTRLLNQTIKWNSDIDLAEQEAKKSKRLIFWVNMLGKMDGFT